MTTAQAKTTDSLAAIVFAVFAVACIGAFLFYRGSDVGHLGDLVRNLLGGPLLGSAFGEAVTGLAVAMAISTSWFGLGGIVVRLAGPQDVSAPLTNFLLYYAVGAASWSLIWFFLGLIGLYSAPAALICLGIGLALTPIAVRQARKANKPRDLSESRTSSPRFAQTLVALALLLAVIASLAPPIAKDSLLYHFSVPKAFVTQHSNGFIDGNIASYLAMGTEMHYVWAMLLGGLQSPRAAEAGAGAVSFLFFPLVLLSVYGWSRELNISRKWAVIASALVATVPTAFHVASSGYIDLALALFITLATYSLTRWWKKQTWNWAVMMAIFLGAALSIKLTAVFVVAGFALIVLLRARTGDGTGRVVGEGFAALLLAGAIASPWYIRTWIATGSPVFPFYMSIWPGKVDGWDVERSNLFQAMNSQYGGVDENKLNLVTAPVRASVAAQPEQAAYYDGVLGVAFLIGSPVLVWGLWKFDLAIEIKIAAGIAGIIYLFWLFSSEQLRYLLPILPLLAICIAAAAEAVTKTRATLDKVVRCSLVAACVCGAVTSFAWFCQKAPMRVVLGGETRDQYLTRNLDYYSYYQSINTSIPAESRVWLINMRRDTYNIDRQVFSDYLFEDWTLRKLVWQSRDVAELRGKAAAMNVQYVLARHDFLFNYDRSTLVDDNAPTAVNEAKLKMARDFLLDPQRTIRADDRFSLTKVF